jgi:methylenetetrahydrofolate dehydrogenase (NADP+)/methenyltetrahydrofolate cyclohydrolase
MTAQLIDGTSIAAQVRAQVAQRVQALRARGVWPGLAVILVGDDPASTVYVRHKVADCEGAGMRSVLERYPATMTEQDLLARVRALNADDGIHGILVQMPLPKHIDPLQVITTISPSKDVDGFHVANAGALVVGQPGFKACTPYGCMKLIETTGAPLRGKHAVVIGRSNTVGKPMALMLLQANATVTVCHSGTADLAAHTRSADIVVAAVGKRDMLRADMVKPGAIVIDVGMNRNDAGKLCGDVDFAAVREVAGWITPVPGGVGPMTRAMLLVNTLEAA